jgi:AraC-like DNA-binding protein
MKYKTRRVAKALGITPRHLQRLCWKMMDMTPERWLSGLKLEEALGLIESGMSATRVAKKLGYPDLTGLSRDFRRHHGVNIRTVQVALRRVQQNDRNRREQ